MYTVSINCLFIRQLWPSQRQSCRACLLAPKQNSQEGVVIWRGFEFQALLNKDGGGNEPPGTFAAGTLMRVDTNCHVPAFVLVSRGCGKEP